MKIVTRILWAICIVVALCSCTPTPLTGDQKIAYDQNVGETYMRRYVDRDAGVVCWIYSSVGVDCLPISQTKLGGGQ